MEAIDYGVCRLAVVPVRADQKESSHQVTQLLFGDHYAVTQLSSDKRWVRIRVHADGAEGWVDARQHHAISPEYYEQINQTDFKITTEVTSQILYRKMPLTIVMGSIVPVSSGELFKIDEQFAFNGEAKGMGQVRDVEYLKTIARKYLGSPGLLGGKSPFGLDASALIQLCFRICGYSLGRDLKSQSLHGKAVKNLSASAPGDVVFFAGKGGAISHAGILVEDGKVIHVSGNVRMDMVLEDGLLNVDTKVYTHGIHSIRRVI